MASISRLNSAFWLGRDLMNFAQNRVAVLSSTHLFTMPNRPLVQQNDNNKRGDIRAYGANKVDTKGYIITKHGFGVRNTDKRLPGAEQNILISNPYLLGIYKFHKLFWLMS